VLVVILSATFMQLLDISIVGVGIASIQATLGASFADTQLVLVGYQIGFAAFLILAARLGDIYGRRRLFLVGMAAFTLTSIAGGLAGTIDILLVARVVQGLASALMFSQVLAIIQVLFDAKERGAALGAYGTTIGLGTILGPVAGGALIQADLTTQAWRPIFLVNVPIGVVAFLAAAVLLPDSRAPRRPRLDVPGAVLSAVGLGAVLYALSEGRTRGWPGWLLCLLVAGLAVLAAFLGYERWLARTGRDPILDTRLFTDRAFRVGAALNVLFYAGVPGFFLVFSLYLQAGQGFDALGTGLAIFAYAVGAAITASNADAVAARIGNRVLIIGTTLLVAGMAAMTATAALVGTHPHVYSWIPAMAVSGLGFGLFVPPIIDIVLVNVDTARAGIASGVLTTLQQVGGAIGVAALGIVFFGLIGHNAPAAATRASTTLRTDLTAAGLPAAAATGGVTTFERCFVTQVSAADPTVAPPDCQTSAGTPAPVAAAYAAAARTATADTYAVSFTQAMSYQIAVYLLTLALVLALPRANPRQLAQQAQTLSAER
jgi:EmrB/QacA subfamily drug resistance transporter